MNEVMIQMVEKPSLLSETPVNSKEEAIEVCLKQISNLTQECMIVINFDTELIPLNMCMVGLGSPWSAPARPADVFKSAILSNARYVIVAHNHPYPGSLKPSGADLESCMDIALCGYHLGIMLWDCIICQGESYMSFQDCFPEYINVEKILEKLGYDKIKNKQLGH